MAKDWMKALNRLEGAVTEDYNPFAHVIRTPSPSVNFTFGKSHGLPLGYTLALWGPPKGGKSVICNATIGQFHADYIDGIAVKFNTEMREMGQLTPEQAKMWGIDHKRYVAYDVNHPEMIFDRIEKDIAAMCQEGAPIKLIIIDSLNAVQGRRSLNADSIMTQQIGDLALTLKDGMKRILPIQRKYKIGIIMTTHVAAEMDPTEQMRGNKTKMAAGFGVQHHAEYFMYVEPNRAKAGRTDLLGKEMVDENNTDMMDKGERLGHKIRVCMKDSSMGPKNRTGEFTLDYDLGIISTHEEVFLLGVNRNIIERPNNLSYGFGDKKWAGKPAMLQALAEDPDLRNAIITELRRRDLAGRFAAEDAAAAPAATEAAEAEVAS